MNQRRSVSVVAGAALVLGCAPLSAIYAGLFEWLIPAALAVAVVVGASIGVRALRGNALLQVLAMFAAGLQFCVLMFRSGGEIAGVVPSAETFAHFGALMASAGEDVRVMEVPVEATEGLVFLLVVGVAGLAILTELFTSLLRSPSLVGIPLLALYLVPVALYPESTPWIVFLPGAAGYLWLLMTDNVDRVRSYGRRFSGDGRGLGEWEASPLATTGRWITVAILPLALILPALIPGVTNGLVDEFAEGFGAEAGDGDGDGSGFNRVNPVAGLQGALDTTQTWEVGFVSTDDPDPGRMKMWSASELTEDGFQPDTDAEGEGTQAASGTVDYPDGVHNGVESETYEATFKATGLEDRALPLYDGLSSIDVDGSWRWDSNAETVTSESDTTKDLEYTYTYEKYDYTEDALRAAGPVAADAPYTDHPSNDEVASLVDELTADQETQYDKVLSIFNYFSRDNGFSYQVRTEDGWSSSAIVDFLHEKQGYCQQYAAAMGWMVRQAEIPARVAIGLTRGSSTNEGYRLTNFNFHAWVEVYFDEIGWVPFDPTPSQGVRTSVEDDWAPDPNRGDEGEGGGDDGTGVDEHGDDNSDDGGGTGEEEGGQQQTAVVVRDGTSPPTIWPYWAAAGAMIALAFLTPMVARATRRRRRLSISNAKTDKAVHAAWKELDDTLVDLGYTVDPSDTPRALGDRLATEAGLSRVSAAGVRHLAAAEAQARYAPRPPEGLTLAHAYRVAKVGLEAGRPPLARLRAWLFPISLLSWWRRGLSRAVDATGNGVIKTRLAVRRVLGRVLPRRGRAA